MDGLPTAITHVQPDSIADRLGLRAGDVLMRIAGENIIDQVDYQALTAREQFTMDVRRGEQELTFKVFKEDWEPLGLTLDQSIVSRPRQCANHCIFCFIDQMPPNMRDTLYVKDDDWRLSLMMGNFITMTNLPEREMQRILRRRPTPLYISVHTTDPDLRVRMLRNPGAGDIMDRLRRLAEAGIRFHCQVVLCPGWNDGEALGRTIRDLRGLWPAARSMALVPVGLTRYREGLDPICPYTRESAAALIDSVAPLQAQCLREIGTRFVFPADEFYCLSGYPLPPDEAYEDYPQAENGVGMLRLFETDLRWAAEDYPVPQTPPRRLLIACGTSIAPFFRQWCGELAPRGTQIEVRPIVNHFFGPSVTVSGLITGGDLTAQLQDADCDEILIARSMVRNEGDLFLDDMPLERVRALLPAPLRLVENTGEAFWRAISGLEEHKAWQNPSSPS